MTRIWGTILAAVACLLLASQAPLWAQATEFESYPLEPPDTTSPRSTLRSFLRHANDAIQHWRSEDSTASVNHAALRALRCLDLSHLPPAVRDELGVEKLLLLKEILDRIELPAFTAIPGAEQVEEGVTAWTIPRTEITIAQVEDGRHQGEFLFDAKTVDDLEHYYALVQHLPYKRNATVGIYEDVVRAPGDWIPRDWVDGLPDWAEEVVLEEAVWQWMALVLALILFVTVMTLLYRLASRWDRRRRRGFWQIGRILFVIALMSLSQVFVAFVDHGINISGRVLIVVEVALDVLVYVAGGWLIALVLNLVAEAIIHAQGLRRHAINSQLIRVSFRLLTIIVLLYLAIVAAEAFGVPVAPLIASLGVGGLALALAVRPTLENILGGFTLFADKPVGVGDLCQYGERLGTVEEIGLRSTRIRSLERTVVTVPNAEFSQMQLENYSRRDQMLLRTTLGLRYETSAEQLRYVLAKLRELLIAHPMVSPEPARVRFLGFGDYSLNLEIFAYVLTSDRNVYLGVVEDLNLRMMDIVEGAGTGFAFPSQTTYLTRDKAPDAERGSQAEAEVADWRSNNALPFPDPDPRRRRELSGTLDYPPKGAPDPEDPAPGPPAPRRHRRWHAED